jgi:hypothetical protein
VDGDVIEASWANATISDLAVQMNNVLTRDGLLGPTEPMLFPNGSVLAPSIAFATQTGLGFFRDGQNAISLASSGVIPMKWSNTDTNAMLPFGIPDGTEAAPSLRFSSDTDTGFYLEPGVLGISVNGAGIIDVANAGVMFYRAASFPRLGVERGTLAVPSIALNVEQNTGIYSEGVGILDVGILGVKRAAFSATGLAVIGGISGATLALTSNAVIDGALNVTGVLAAVNLTSTNITAQNLYIGSPTSSGLIYRSSANTLYIRVGDGPSYAGYFFGLSTFTVPMDISAARQIYAAGSGYDCVVSPAQSALAAAGSYGGGLLLNWGANGFLQLYLLASGAGRMRCYNGSNAEWTYQFNADGSLYGKILYGFTDGGKYTMSGYVGANCGMWMYQSGYSSSVTLDNQGNIAFITNGLRAYVGATSGFHVVDGAGRAAPVMHAEAGVAITDANSNINVTFAVLFTNASIVFGIESANASTFQVSITSRGGNSFGAKVFFASTGGWAGAGITVHWQAQERNQ